MKRYILIAVVVLSLVGVFFAFSDNYSVPEPRIRVNKTSTQAMTTSWQTLDFDGTSTFNVNTFGSVDAAGNKMVQWDSTNKLFKFMGDYDRNFDTTLFLSTSTNLITTRASIQVRYVIPNGVSPGVDLYIPFPDESQPYVDAGEVTLLANGVRHLPLPNPLYSNATIRANGLRVQVRLSNSLITLGVCNLTSAAMLIQD